MQHSTHSRLLSIKETAKYLGKSEWSIRHLVRIRAIPLVRIGKKRLYVDRVALEEWLKKQSIGVYEEEL